jgi:hypothetical protein
MRRTSILVDPVVLTELERLARVQGRPTAHVIREAMERYVMDERKTRELPGFIGLGSGPGDVAERDEQILEHELPSAVSDDSDLAPG